MRHFTDELETSSEQLEQLYFLHSTPPWEVILVRFLPHAFQRRINNRYIDTRHDTFVVVTREKSRLVIAYRMEDDDVIVTVFSPEIINSMAERRA